MDPEVTEELQNFLNQTRLDFLIRGLAQTVLRRKFKEIYAQLNEGQKWTDGPGAGQNFRRSKWGNSAFAKANFTQREMMDEGQVQVWDVSLLQLVIKHMLTTAIKDKGESNSGIIWKGKNSGQPPSPPVIWHQKWLNEMADICLLADIRNSVSHMSTAAFSQDEFEEKWGEAVVALKGLGAQQAEVDHILKFTQSAYNFASQQSQGQQGENTEFKAGSQEEGQTYEDLLTKIKELELNQSLNQNQVEIQTEIRGQVTNENVNVPPVMFNKKNESKANSLTKNGDSAGKSEDWDKALEFYTRALDVPDISDDLQKKIYMNRSWAHLKILQLSESELPFDFSICTLFNNEKLEGQSSSKRETKFVDEKLLEMDYPKIPENLTQEMKDLHLTAGMADAQLALELSSDQTFPKAFYRLARFHQLKGDWKSALACFDLALDQSDMDDVQLQFDRNVCQLEVLNQAELEEYYWVPGKKYQTMAGLVVSREPSKWNEIVATTMDHPQHKLLAQVVSAHFNLKFSWTYEGWESEAQRLEATKRDIDRAVKSYEEAAKGGLPSGMYNLGLLLQEGNGIQRDFSCAIRLFKMAAHFSINEDGNDEEKTPDWVKESVFEAQYRLGLCYEFGLGVDKDWKKALHWYEMASLGDYGRASRKLGDIYSHGLLRVTKDEDMAIFCWEHAASNGDAIAAASAAHHYLQLPHVTWDHILHSLACFSKAIAGNVIYGTSTMMASMYERKPHFESALAAVLQDKSKFQPNPGQKDTEENEDREAEALSWNPSALVNHTLHTIHLLEMVQNPAFHKKLQENSDWQTQFIYTERLLRASSFCHVGLSALQKLNKLYQEKSLVEPTVISYPPDLRKVSEVDSAALSQEAELVAVILISFAESIRLVGAAFFRDEPTFQLMHCLATKAFNAEPAAGVAPTWQELTNKLNSALILGYAIIVRGVNWEETCNMFVRNKLSPPSEPFFATSAAAVQGSLGKFEMADKMLEEFLTDADLVSKVDLLFAQALCRKSAALTRGVSSANRKKVRESMDIFQKFLTLCPKDDPRRATAHYQLALCTLYLEKMNAKGQVKGQGSESAKVILTKVMTHFIQGEEAEQELPWKEFQLVVVSPVKRILQQKIQELEGSVKNVTGQNVTSKFSPNLKGERRVKVITNFRKFFKAARESGLGSSSSLPPAEQQENLMSIPGSPLTATPAILFFQMRGCYEIIEPVLLCRIPHEDCPEVEKIVAFTVIQDEKGAALNLTFGITVYQDEDKNLTKQIADLWIGSKIVFNRPTIQLDPDGGASLSIVDANVQIFNLSTLSNQQEDLQQENSGRSILIRKCGFCGETEGKLEPCAKCEKVFYCGKECQTADWKELKHKWVCPFLK